MLTLPVTTAGLVERSFSKIIVEELLKRRTKNVAIIPIEHEIVDELDMDNVIATFADLKSRKVNF